MRQATGCALAPAAPPVPKARPRLGLVGIVPFVLVHLPIVLLAASIGVWLFYVQHQFEGTTWDRDEIGRAHV